MLFYDPAGRVVATLHPDHSWEKVVFDSWRQESWDASDTVLIADPKTDPDVGDYFARLPDSEYLPSWHDARISGARGMEAKTAAEKTAIHAATPLVAHSDVMGRGFLAIAHNAWKTSQMAIGDPRLEEFHETRTVFDAEGNQRAVIDAHGRIVMRFDFDMLGRQIAQHGMDGGSRWTLSDVAGNPIRGWDMRGHTIRSDYDVLHRPLATYVTAQGGAEAMVMQTVYGEGQPTPEANNLRGKAYQMFDQAGGVTTPAYDFKGNALSSSRQLTQDYKATIDWAGPVPLEPQLFATHTRYDALNRPIAITTPDGSVIQPGFNEANLLERVDVDLLGAGSQTAFVTNIDYDAKGQRMAIAYCNGATTRYAYDPESYRLTDLKTERGGFPAGESVVQDLHYTYDIAGNITRIGDLAQQAVFFNNQLVEPSCTYTYDAVHRLIEATGREHLGQTGGQANAPTPSDAFDAFRRNLPQPGDGNAMGTYIERYAYDAVGNILQMQHRGSSPASPGWTRTFSYDAPSLIEPGKTNNRLTETSTGGTGESYAYDGHGNMLNMAHLSLMTWNAHDQLQATARTSISGGGGTPETTYYVYDAGGERVRKVTERQAGSGQSATRKQERIYLAGYEIFREYASDGASVDLERQTLHVMDDQRRIALVETRSAGNDGSPAQLIRYQMGNHLGSASLELDDAGAVISYEEYTPYGSTSYHATRGQQEAAKRYRYTGKERDEETGLNYHSARYYAPWLTRWVSADPIGIGDGVNLYGYCGSRPVTSADDTGTEEVEFANIKTAKPGDTYQGQTLSNDGSWWAKEVIIEDFRPRLATPTFNISPQQFDSINHNNTSFNEAIVKPDYQYSQKDNTFVSLNIIKFDHKFEFQKSEFEGVFQEIISSGLNGAGTYYDANNLLFSDIGSKFGVKKNGDLKKFGPTKIGSKEAAKNAEAWAGGYSKIGQKIDLLSLGFSGYAYINADSAHKREAAVDLALDAAPVAVSILEKVSIYGKPLIGGTAATYLGIGFGAISVMKTIAGTDEFKIHQANFYRERAERSGNSRMWDAYYDYLDQITLPRTEPLKLEFKQGRPLYDWQK